jgi:putative ABC transport system permease protein
MLKSYFKTAVRFLLKNKTFSLINLFGLAMGTLSCLYILLYVQDQYSYDKHHAPDTYRINTLWSTPTSSNNWATVTAPVAPAMKKDFPEVAAFARLVPPLNVDYQLLRYKDKSLFEKRAVYADSSLFSIFTFHFIEGDPKTALAAPYNLVLRKEIADRLFGQQTALGKTLTIENRNGKHDFTITGVIDETLGKTHLQANLFLSMNSGGMGDFTLHNNSWTGMNIVMSYIKLKPGANPAELEKKLPAFVSKYGGDQLKGLKMQKRLHLQKLASIHTTPGFKGYELSKTISPGFLYTLILVAILIQIVACINFMNLSTAKASKRAKEVGIRKVTGAQKTDIIRQFLGESLLLATIGILIAVPLLLLLLPYLNRITEATIHLSAIANLKFAASLTALALITGLLAGSYPAFYLSAFQTIKVIKGNFTSHISAAGIRRALVVFQFVLSIVLVTVIVVIYSQLNYIKNKDLGFEKEQKLIFSFHTEEAVQQIPALTKDLKNLAGIKDITRASKAPGESLLYDNTLYLAGGTLANGVNATLQQTDEHFLKTTGIKLLTGRDFQAYDTDRIIINKTLATQFGLEPNKAPGTKVYTEYNGETVSYEIAGVMNDYNFSSLHEEIKPEMLMYTPFGGREIIVSTNTDKYSALLSKMETIWHNHLPAIPFEYRFISDEVKKHYEAETTLSNIINSFAIMAIAISCLGLFGLAAFNAEQRSKEIGIRKVLGASVTSITTLLSTDFIKLIIIAFIIATPIAGWAMFKWLQNFAYRITLSWWMFALAGAMAIAIAAITVGYQSIKAALANPLKRLRSE